MKEGWRDVGVWMERRGKLGADVRRGKWKMEEWQSVGCWVSEVEVRRIWVEEAVWGRDGEVGERWTKACEWFVSVVSAAPCVDETRCSSW
jgi:hypothetical protein